MGTPLTHAESSAKRFGGSAYEYLPIHCWMDSSRTFIGDFRHRYMRHHTGGVADANRRFGETLRNNDGLLVPITDIVNAHILEDLGTIPTPTDWFKCVDIQPWMQNVPAVSLEDYIKVPDTPEKALAYTEALSQITDWLDAVEVDGINGSSRMFRYTSFTITDAWSLVGPIVERDGYEFSTDRLIETVIMHQFGRIPSAYEWAMHIRPEVWMGLARDKTDVSGITSMLPTKRGCDRNDNFMSHFQF